MQVHYVYWYYNKPYGRSTFRAHSWFRQRKSKNTREILGFAGHLVERGCTTARARIDEYTLADCPSYSRPAISAQTNQINHQLVLPRKSRGQAKVFSFPRQMKGGKVRPVARGRAGTGGVGQSSPERREPTVYF